MFNKKSPNTPLLLLNCASKNSLKNLFKLNAQAKINLNKGILAYHPIRKGRIIVVLPSAKLILPIDRGIFTSGGIFLIKLNQFITKKKFS